VAGACGITEEEVIEIHASQIYEVWMLGFLPGFPYLGPLPSRLQLRRKEFPNPQVLAGSVAIAEEYCGMYPFESPGGWHVLGRSPKTMGEYPLKEPFLFSYGQVV